MSLDIPVLEITKLILCQVDIYLKNHQIKYLPNILVLQYQKWMKILSFLNEWLNEWMNEWMNEWFIFWTV